MVKKIKYLMVASLAIAFMFAFTGCHHKSSNAMLFLLLGLNNNASNTPIINESGGNIPASNPGAVNGISDNTDLTVVNGKIVVNVDDGVLVISGENVTISEQVDGVWALAPDITITLQDNSGANVPGTVVVDPVTGNVLFVPDSPLDVDMLYTLVVTTTDATYTATVVLAVDDTGEADSMFADVPIHSTAGTYAVQDCIVNGKAIFGWEFPPRFKIRLLNLEAGATVTLNFFGTYDVPAYEDLVFYQRWASTGNPVKDYSWDGNWIQVDEIDSSIDGDIDYSFKRTYAEIHIIDADGNDITSQSAATFEVVTL